ncbi:MAG: DUF202 domain-containing protein [Nitrospinae bacterium]|nr:DUF202 domain-containing protein [Nitrospinota bacterium]
MIISKKLPPARDARIYMSVERTYLGYLRFGVYIVSFAVFAHRLWMLVNPAGGAGGAASFHLFVTVVMLAGTGGIALSLFSFRRDVQYIDGGIEVPKEETKDPRIYMAAERTFLAWVRTSISLIIFGFVVENFEILLKQIGKAAELKVMFRYFGLVEVGIFIILIGIATVVIGVINFQNAVKQIDAGAYRTNVNVYRVYGSILFVTCLALIVFLFNIV